MAEGWVRGTGRIARILIFRKKLARATYKRIGGRDKPLLAGESAQYDMSPHRQNEAKRKHCRSRPHI